MPVNLSIKNVSDHLAERLRQRAVLNHRSLQGELLAIIEAAEPPGDIADIRALREEISKLGLSTPSDSVEIIRAARDGR